MRVLTILSLLIVFINPAISQWTASRPDGHAPLGVMGDHTHHAGEFMLSYRFMTMNMEGSLDGTDSIDDADVVSPTGSNFLITPTKMPMQMHMLGVMYALTDDLTLMAMVNLLSSDMEHLMRNGNTFETSAAGLGDTRFSALFVLKRFSNQQIHLNAGVSIPTGSFEEKDVTPMSAPNETQLPYPMQLGSGTFDILPGITYLGQHGMWSWGGQVNATFRFGDNDNDYHLGNRFFATFWSARQVANILSVSARLESSTWGNIEGADPAYTMAVANRMVPTVFSDLRGGTRINGGLGVNFYLQNGALHGLRFAVEALLPLYQDLNGPQLETDLSLIFGTQYAF